MLRSIPTDNVVYDYRERSFMLFSVEDLALVKDFQSIMPHTQHFCNKWNVPFDYMLGKLREKGYLHKMLSFAYDIHGKTNVYQYSQLVQENYFHTTKREWWGGKQITVTNEYDVYITILASAERDSRGIYTVNGIRMLIGESVHFKIKSFAASAYIVKTEIPNETVS